MLCVNLYGVRITINEELKRKAASLVLEKDGRACSLIVWLPALFSAAPASVLKLASMPVTGAGVGVRATCDEQNVLKP